MKEEMIKDVFSTTKEITLGDKVFKIKSINLTSLATWQEWCLDKLKDDKKKESKEKVKELIDIYKMAGQEPDIKEIIRIKKEDDNVVLTPEDSDNFINSINGICYLIQLVINDNNDEKIDIDFVKKNLEVNEVGKITEMIMSDFINNMTTEPEEPVKNQKAKSQSGK